MNIKFIYFIFCSFLMSQSLLGQMGNISGKVLDRANKSTLVGATIQLVESNLYTTTDINGNFFFPNIQTNTQTLISSYIGYKSDTIENISCDALEPGSLQIILQEDNINLPTIEITSDPQKGKNIVNALSIHSRPIKNAQSILPLVPGLFINQHAGGGKAEQILWRGFDLDHGTDIQLSFDGMPINMVSHAHGQGYADLHFILPELIDAVEIEKGPYQVANGNFSTAGSVHLKTRNHLKNNQISIEAGNFDTYRAFGGINLLDKQNQKAYIAGEYLRSNGYFESPQDLNRINLFAKYNSLLSEKQTLTISASTFSSQWKASGQIPQRAVNNGTITRFGAIDDTEGGKTSRHNLNASLLSSLNSNTWFKNQFFINTYEFDLISNFTFYLEDPINGDRIRQTEKRTLIGYNGNFNKLFYWNNLKLKAETGLQFRMDNIQNNTLSHVDQSNKLLSYRSLANIHEKNAATYIRLTAFPTSKIQLNAGLRYDHFFFDQNDLLVEGASTPVHNEGIWSPKMNAYFTLHSKLQLNVSTGYSFHSNDTRVAIDPINPSALAKSFGSDIALIYKPFKKLILQGTLWHLEMDEELVYVGDESIVERNGPTRRAGIDFTAYYQFKKYLYADVDLNATYARSRQSPNGSNYLPLAPLLTSSGGIR